MGRGVLPERVLDANADLDSALLIALETTIPRYIQTIRRALDDFGDDVALTLPQFRCLKAIAAQGVTLTTHLARQIQVTVPTMTSRLDGLVERGLVQRQPDPLSRRQVRVSLTAAGDALLARYQAAIATRLGEVLAPLSADARARLLSALDDLDSALVVAAERRVEEPAARDG
ncbi:MAG TPA: MarR family transcriptional regulator [Thermomicrobiales bacterium]|jgi:DNA-binding MarR family transcriptional regulator